MAAKKKKAGGKLRDAPQRNPWRKQKAQPDFAAGVFLGDQTTVVAVSRGKVDKFRYDWGLPASLQRDRETPVQTAGRALQEETGLYVPLLEPRLFVPASFGQNACPLIVFAPAPGIEVVGMIRGSAKGMAKVISLSQFCGHQMRHCESNRYIVYNLLGGFPPGVF